MTSETEDRRMKIALLGYGKMGREVEQAAVERGHSITSRFTSHHTLTGADGLRANLAGVDCCIDFSVPSATVEHIKAITPLHLPLVVGTTGWHDHLPQLSQFVKDNQGTLFHAPNFSIGAHILLCAVERASELVDRFPDYDVGIHEIHHRSKKDAPSGTALALASSILDRVGRKKVISPFAAESQVQQDELVVSSSRLGSATGTHTVMFDSPVDSIYFVHTVRSRRAFAVGAVLAAEWVLEREGVFTMKDFLFT